jgi:hypothetical protein
MPSLPIVSIALRELIAFSTLVDMTIIWFDSRMNVRARGGAQ